MYSLHIVPRYITDEVKSRGNKPEEILMAVPSDISLKGFFSEHWVLVDRKKIMVISGTVIETKIRNPLSKDDSDKSNWKCTGLKEYMLDNIKKVKIHDLVSGGYLVSEDKDNGSERILARFTANRRREFAVIVKNITRLKDGKEIDKTDFDLEKHSRYCPKCGRIYPDRNRKICPKCLDKRSIILRIFSFAKNYKIQYILIIIFMILSAAFGVIRPYLEGNVFFDQVLLGKGRFQGKVGLIVMAIVLSQGMMILLNILLNRVNAGVTANIIYDIKTKMFTSLETLSMNYFSKKKTGALMTRVSGDSNRLQYFFHDGMPYIFTNSVVLTGSVIAMLVLNLKMALLVLIPLPLVLIATKKLWPVLYSFFGKFFRKRRKLNSILNDSLVGFRVIKAFGKEKVEIDRFGKANDELKTANIKMRQYIGTMFPILNSFVHTGALLVWAVGGWQVATGDMTFGTLIAFVRYVGMMYQPLRFMTHILDWGSNSLNSAQRIFEIIDSNPDVYDDPDCVNVENLKGDIKFNKVVFSYEPNKPVIKNISFKIKRGEMVGIVGKSGAGKSTLANLMLRLYDTDEGNIFIDGVNIKKLSLESLHKNIGIVMQDTFLFSGSVAENITFGRPEASREEIIKAAKMANAHDFIMKLPEAYDTMIGNAGQDLSGGERQRISIARTILHNPSILILDEATASVDTKTEQEIQKALETLIKGKTAVVIAHRLSTLRVADRILVIKNGEIIEEGTHDELLANDGEFKKMYTRQKEALELKEVI